MPIEVYDADGNVVEGVLAAEEAAKIQADLAAAQEKLTKLENKEFNFKKLRDMTDVEKEKLTATEISLKQQADELEEKHKSFTEGFVKDVKNDVLSRFAGDDEELRKKIEFNFDRLKGSDTARSREEISQLMNEAYTLSVGNRPTNLINNAINYSGSAPVKPSATLDSDVLNVAKNLGLSEEDLKKYSK